MFLSSIWLFFWDFLNLEESVEDREELIGEDGSSGEGDDSDESETTGMIFFFVI